MTIERKNILTSIYIIILILVYGSAYSQPGYDPRRTIVSKNFGTRDTIFFMNYVNGKLTPTGSYIYKDSVNNRLVFVGTIYAPGLIGGGGGGGGSITDIRNTDGTIFIKNSTGPLDTIGINVGSIINAMLANESVTGSKIANGTITSVDISFGTRVTYSDTSTRSITTIKSDSASYAYLVREVVGDTIVPAFADSIDIPLQGMTSNGGGFSTVNTSGGVLGVDVYPHTNFFTLKNIANEIIDRRVFFKVYRVRPPSGGY